MVFAGFDGRFDVVFAAKITTIHVCAACRCSEHWGFRSPHRELSANQIGYSRSQRWIAWLEFSFCNAGRHWWILMDCGVCRLCEILYQPCLDALDIVWPQHTPTLGLFRSIASTFGGGPCEGMSHVESFFAGYFIHSSTKATIYGIVAYQLMISSHLYISVAISHGLRAARALAEVWHDAEVHEPGHRRCRGRDELKIWQLKLLFSKRWVHGDLMGHFDLTNPLDQPFHRYMGYMEVYDQAKWRMP